MKARKRVVGAVIGLVLLSFGAKNRDPATEAFEQGVSFVGKGNLDAGIAAFTDAIRLNPQFAEAYYNRGYALDQKRECDKAIADYTDAVRLNPKFVLAYYNRGSDFDMKGDYDKAIADYTEAIRIKPQYANAYDARGIVFGEKREYEKAIIDFTEEIRLEPGRADPYFNRGLAYREKGDYDSAVADYTTAIRLDPKLAAAYANRGLAYSYKRDYDKAIGDCTKAIALDPQSPRPYGNRAAVLVSKGDFDSAMADYAIAISLDPKCSKAYYDRGLAYARKGDSDRAIADLDAALRLSPESPCYYEVRGTIRIRREDYGAGIADLHTAIRLDPCDPAARFEAPPKQPLTAEASHHGQQQVQQMLRNRPAMAQFGKKAGVLYQWAARKFAGEDLHREVFWDASEPPFDADSLPPTAESHGRIRIRRTYSDGPNKGKKQSFEAMWSEAVFELYNVANVQEFQRLEKEVAARKLTKVAFVAEKIECESRAAEKTRAFYIHVFLPWAKEQHAPTEPAAWFVGLRSDSRENLLLSRVDKRGTYWRDYEDQYDSILLKGKKANH